MDKNSEQKNDNENKSGLLDGVKADYFVRKIFDNTPENKKFRLIKYNKKLKNRLNISIDDYFNALITKFEKSDEGKRTPENFKDLFKNHKTQLKKLPDYVKFELFRSISLDEYYKFKAYPYDKPVDVSYKVDYNTFFPYLEEIRILLKDYFLEEGDFSKLETKIKWFIGIVPNNGKDFMDPVYELLFEKQEISCVYNVDDLVGEIPRNQLKALSFDLKIKLIKSIYDCNSEGCMTTNTLGNVQCLALKDFFSDGQLSELNQTERNMLVEINGKNAVVIKFLYHYKDKDSLSSAYGESNITNLDNKEKTGIEKKQSKRLNSKGK